MAASEMEKFATLVVGEMHEMEDRLSKRMDGMDSRLDKIDSRLDRIEVRLDHIEAELSIINKRLDILEEQGASNAGFAKEIDELRTRVRILETTLANKN